MIDKRPSLEELVDDKQKAVEIIAQVLCSGKTKERIPEYIERAVNQALSLSQKLASSDTDVHGTARVAAEIYFLIDSNFKGEYKQIHPFSQPLDQAKVNETIGNFGRTAKKITEKIEQGIRGGMEQKPQEPLEQYASEDSIKKLLLTLFKKGITPKDVESQVDALEPNKVGFYLRDLGTVITAEGTLEKEPGAHLYPEWGNDILDYRPNWVKVREQNLEGGSNQFYLETTRRHKGLIKTIRREFQMLRPEGPVKLRGQFDGNDIDLDAAVQYFIDKRLKLCPSERNYIRIERKSRDIAVAFLVDVSASTGGTTIACEKEALIIMSEALQELGDAFAIYAFSGFGRENVMFYNIKDFEEPYGQKTQSKISAMESKQATRIAPAIRHTAMKLRTREEKTKLIILLSDGKPQDTGYHGDYAIEDARMALRESRGYGIKSFCITVDKEVAGYLPRMYANSRWVVIDDVAKLPNKITRIYRLFTT
ncbi:VWA domain-containing protein [Candidatus Woesearchaeota archaeon]|nr:VWA domain-containing protein [Candidatus Woesearchaeota archaeon]